MGLDFLDVGLRIEEQFGVRVDWQLVKVRDRKHPDITAGDLLDCVEAARLCVKCEYDLRGHPDTGICPECGSAFVFGNRDRQSDWEALRQLLSEALNIKPSEITPESRLIRDLGMTETRVEGGRICVSLCDRRCPLEPHRRLTRVKDLASPEQADRWLNVRQLCRAGTVDVVSMSLTAFRTTAVRSVAHHSTRTIPRPT